MFNFADYQSVSRIFESADTLIYRGRRNKDNLPVILKILKGDYPEPEKFATFRHEYNITRILDAETANRSLAIEKYNNSLAIVFNDFGGESLNKLLFGKTYSLEEFLVIAGKIAKALEGIHALSITHKDINPSNIVYNLETGQLKIIDFGISTLLSHEDTELKDPNTLKGTLAYISPEQTGRMNRSLDFRTDFYSLGVTFYEIICRRLPFTTGDPLELVHSHIARNPIAPHKLNPEIPEVVSGIIMKLMSKNAEDRYKSARGIRKDLEKSLNQLQVFGKIKFFFLAQHDISEKFHIIHKLYGRESEIKAIMDGFDRVSDGGLEALMVTGYSGVGKTSLIREVNRRITLQNAYFISGKFDQFQRDIPYKAILNAFKELISRILWEDDSALVRWRNKILQALGPNASVIAEVIPEVEMIIGQQSAVAQIGPIEAQNRFNLVFRDFIRIFLQPKYPLVLFFDDLQWADTASLKLMELIMTDERLNGLFLIGAFRDNEVGPDHPLTISLDNLKKEAAVVNQIPLPPLQLEDICRMVIDSLSAGNDHVQQLAELLIRKTGGNPFFAEMFLRSIYEENLLEFNREQGMWQWDIDRIQARGITDNVVDLLTGKIQKIGKKTQYVLQSGACIGNEFDLLTLAAICDESAKDIYDALQDAMEEGLVMPIGEDYKLIDSGGKGMEEGITIGYRFRHNRIQKVVHSLISETEKQSIHLKIGQFMLENIPAGQWEENIFDIVNQLNPGHQLIDQQTVKDDLAHLNQRAGRKAKASAAWESAFNYLRAGIRVLGEESWDRQYDLTLALYVETAEAAYLCGRFSEMDEFAQVVLDRGRTLLDRVQVYEVKIEASKAQYKLLEAVDTALYVLKMLGISFPKKPNKFQLLLELIRAKMSMLGKQIDELAELPEINDPIKSAALRIISSAGSAAYFADPELLPLIVFKGVRLSVKSGSAPESAFLYAVYGMIHCGVLGNIDSGYRFGLLALDVLRRFGTEAKKAKTYHMVNAFIVHWKRHVKETIKPLSSAFQSGLEVGDFEYAGFCAFFCFYHSFCSGIELSSVEQSIIQYRDAIGNLKHETSYYVHAIFRQTLANLTGQSKNPCSLNGEIYNEQAMLPLHLQAKDRTTLYLLYFSKFFLSYMFGDYLKAVEDIENTEMYQDGAVGLIFVPLFHFYDSLARLAVFSDSDKSVQKQILKKVTANQKKMKKWANHAPMNHLHKYYLVKAELRRVQNHYTEAGDYYDQAINLAKEHEYINEQALANELAARFYEDNGKNNLAGAFIRDARSCYLRWNASAKLKDLDARYGHLFAGTPIFLDLHADKVVNLTSRTSADLDAGLDLASVMKASQAISGEIVLENLLKRLMKIVIENAGAETGFLILKSNGKLQIEAEGVLAKEDVTVLQSVPMEESNKLSISIVNYVIRTLEFVVLGNAAGEGNFTKDLYVVKNRPKSVLCAPVIHKSQLVGVLYLENNLSTGAFTVERLEMLKILSTQIAISLENATLFTNLKESELRYRELYENIVDIVILVDDNDRILIANPLFHTTFNVSGSNEQDMMFKQWIHPDDVLLVEEQMLAKLADVDTVMDFQFRLVTKQGKVLDVECNAKSIKKEDNRSEFQMVIRDITDRKRLEKELINSIKDVQHARIGTILGLAKLAEYRDENTGSHLERIREYSRVIAVELSKKIEYKYYITPRYIDDIYLSAILHDIGKVGIPDSILQKKGKLTDKEFEIIKRHTIYGGDAISAIEKQVEGQSFLALGKAIAYYHHEKWNGSGYPMGLQGEAIPLSTRIVALADVYDALTSKRSYKNAFSHEKSTEIIVNAKGTHFAPEVVDAFLSVEPIFKMIKMIRENHC
ncbi:MAG: AAA family ATPase [Thermodesulfobacteriota bacterium]|nr:AAA family ATPase [Thermodesulfobacteriota bacterium]